MKTELVTVRRIVLSRNDIEEAVKTYVEAHHELTLTGDCERGQYSRPECSPDPNLRSFTRPQVDNMLIRCLVSH